MLKAKMYFLFATKSREALHYTIGWILELAYPLRLSLVRPLVLMVDAAEVRHDDRHRQSYDQHSAKGADASDDLPRYRGRDHVAVAGRRGFLAEGGAQEPGRLP